MLLPCALFNAVLLLSALRAVVAPALLGVLLPVVLIAALLLGMLLLFVFIIPLLLSGALLLPVLVVTLLLLGVLLPVVLIAAFLLGMLLLFVFIIPLLLSGALLLPVLVVTLLLLGVLLPVVLIAAFLLGMLLLFVFIIPLLLLSVLLLFVLVLPLLFGMLRVGLSLLVLARLLFGVVSFLVLLLLSAGRDSDSEKQGQKGCADGSGYSHKCYLHYCQWRYPNSVPARCSSRSTGLPIDSFDTRWSMLFRDAESDVDARIHRVAEVIHAVDFDNKDILRVKPVGRPSVNEFE